jgi:hypothetical protein
MPPENVCLGVNVFPVVVLATEEVRPTFPVEEITKSLML